MILIEAAIDSIADAERAVREGANRLEVCARLDVGGLTPSRELLSSCLTLGVPCVGMARPRAGDFNYNTDAWATLCRDARAIVDGGAHGVVFGCLNDNNTVHLSHTRGIVELAHSRETVFHRAFDDTPDARAALDALMACGVTRVLTSGHAATALQGVDEIAELVQRARGSIEILPGGGVRGADATTIVVRAGVRQVHARGSEPGVIAALRAQCK